MLRDFLHAETVGGAVLLAAVAIALVWSNGPFADGYAGFWQQMVSIGGGPMKVTEDLRHWVNDGLMTLFFLAVGLEIKRELMVGELRDRRAAALPAVAAVGGVVVPAVLYLVIAGGGPAADGWKIPMARLRWAPSCCCSARRSWTTSSRSW